MMRLVISDLERIISKKNTKVVLFMAAFLPVLIYLVVKRQVAYGATAGMNLYNSLNYPVKNVDEFNIILVAIIAPIFFNECLSSEIESGAYKLVMTRPFKKWQFIVSKWISSGIIYLFVILMMFLIKIIIGFSYMPKVEYTSYFNAGPKFNLIGAILFNLKFYLIIFVIHMIILAVISFVSSILKKTVAVFMITEGIIIGAAYFFKAAKDVIFTISSYITGILCGTYNLGSIFIIVLIEAVLFVLSLYIWNKNIGANV